MTWNIAAPFIAGYTVCVGLMVGSFINLAADRLPRGESIISPGSRCRSCGRRLNAVDLLPVLGYILRRGRCATCGVAIGRAAPLVELACGVLVALPILWLGAWLGTAVGVTLLTAYGLATVGRAMKRGMETALLS